MRSNLPAKALTQAIGKAYGYNNEKKDKTDQKTPDTLPMLRSDNPNSSPRQKILVEHKKPTNLKTQLLPTTDSITQKIWFDESIELEKKKEINRKLSELLSRTNPLLLSVLKTALNTDYVKKININSSESPSGDEALGEYDKEDRCINLFECNRSETDMVVASIVHEATHAHQERLKKYPTLRQKIEDGSLVEAFQKDMRSANPEKGLSFAEKMQRGTRMGMIDKILHDNYNSTELPYEIQARIMEDIVQHPARAEAMFPRTIAKMQTIDSEFRQLEESREKSRSL